MKNITKKNVRELLKQARTEHLYFSSGVYMCGAYIYKDKIELYLAYHGQGIDEVIYNGV